MSLEPAQFQTAVLNWYDQHGRKHLPWQQHINPYRVWVSEIMLQQTQVSTVIDYFQRFMQELPTVGALAAAEEDRVLHLWTGLGYYARARNLHRCAKRVMAEYSGEFSASIESLCDLPGIGRSTAGAIRSIAFEQPAAVLDGNVKRVLARHAAIGGWPGKSAVLKELWQAAEQYAPEKRTRDYSQAMMDLGATLCTAKQPQCDVCPLNTSCKALALGQQDHYPGKKPRKRLPVKTTTMLLAMTAGKQIYLEKRPDSGIWGGLWSFPEFDEKPQLQNFCLDTFGEPATDLTTLPNLRHTFSHHHLDITPIVVTLDRARLAVMEPNRGLWYSLNQPEPIGLPRPITKLLKLLED